MSDLIDKTIEVLERDGWCQFAMTNDEGRHCAVGALAVARLELGLGYEETNHAENTMQMLLHEQTGHHIGVMPWNDDCARNVDDVIHLLKLAGEELALQVTQ